ncbi:MAG: hypothetical protein ACTS3F_10745 [Phycisphaerales bacterium]
MTARERAAAALRRWLNKHAPSETVGTELLDLYPEAQRILMGPHGLSGPEDGLVRVGLDAIEEHDRAETIQRHAAGADPEWRPIPMRVMLGDREYDDRLAAAPNSATRARERVRMIADLLAAMPNDVLWHSRWCAAILDHAEARDALTRASVCEDIRVRGGGATTHADAPKRLAEADTRHARALEEIDGLLREGALMAGVDAPAPDRKDSGGVEPVWMTPNAIADITGCVSAGHLRRLCGEDTLRGRRNDRDEWEVDARSVLNYYQTKHKEMTALADAIAEHDCAC